MNSGRKRPRPLAIEPFDPRPSIRVALELLDAAGIPFALAGRLAVWAWVPADAQEFTKDVDFAVPEQGIEALDRAARARGLKPRALSIGGIAIRDGGTRVDFIDRRVDFAALYAEAVDVARREGITTEIEEGVEVPVTPPEHLVAMKLATGDPRDERDVERLLKLYHVEYSQCRRVVRAHLGPAAANRLDHLGARVGIELAARYVR